MIPLSPQTFEEDAGPDLGLADAAEASWELAKQDTFVGNWARNSALDEMEKSGGKILTPEELNQKYPHVEVPFKEPTNELVAFHLNEEAKHKRDLQEIVAKGGGDYGGTISFGAGLVAHMADPVEFGAGAALSLGVGALGAMAARGTFGARAVTAGQIASKGGFVKEAVEGIAGNAILEPYMYNSAERAHQEYTVQDAITNVVAGGLAFPALTFGGKKAWNGLKHVSDSIYGTAIKNTVGAFTDGFKPQVDHIKAAYDKYIFNAPKDADVGPARADYSFSPADVEGMKTRPLYAASRQAGTLDGGVKPLGDYHGDGVYLTDNPTVANNLAAHPMESELPAGDVFQMRADQAKLLDMDTEAREIISNLKLGKNTEAFDFKVEEKNNRIHVTATDKQTGKVVGQSQFNKAGDKISADATMVEKDFRRKGIASEMYSQAEKFSGMKAEMSSVASPDAKGFWENRGLLEEVRSAKTIKEAIDIINEKIDMGDLDDTAMLAFHDELKAMGYDGLKYTDEANGHNGAYIYPESAEKLKTEAMYKSDTASIKPLDKNELKATQDFLRSDENKLEFDTNAKKEWDEFNLEDEARALDISKIEELDKQQIATFDKMAKDELLSKESLDQVAAIKEEKSLWGKTVQAIEDFSNCLIGAAE